MKKSRFITYSLILLLAFGAGCAKRSDGTIKIPLVYRIDVQQGNVIEQSMINKLQAGMSKSKVKFILGTPLIEDPFHSDRWDYIYSFEPGSGEREQRRVSVFFKNDKLSHLTGDIQPGYGLTEDESEGAATNVVVPAEREKEGIFSRITNKDRKPKKKKEGFFSRWFGTDEELKEADETRDEETEKELEALAKEVKEESEKSILPLPERDAEQIERDFEVFEKTGEEF